MVRKQTPPPQTPGQMLRQHREGAGLSLRQLAGQLDVAPSQVTRWEQDEQTPSARSLVRIAQALELPATELFARYGQAQPTEALSLPAMLRREYDLPPEAIAEVQRHIETVANKYKRKKGGT